MHYLFCSEAQILIGGLDKDPNIVGIFSETVPYFNDDQAWCVRRATQTASWKNIFEVFRGSLWIALIFTFTLIALFLYVMINLKYLENRNLYWAFLHGLAICLSMSPRLWTTVHFHLRCILFLLLLYGMFVNMMFSGFLMTTLTKQRFQKQITNINETIVDGFSYAGGQVVHSQLLLRNDKVNIFIPKHRFPFHFSSV